MNVSRLEVFLIDLLRPFTVKNMSSPDAIEISDPGYEPQPPLSLFPLCVYFCLSLSLFVW